MRVEWDVILSALALVLVIEGLLPSLSPDLWRTAVRRLMDASNDAVRLGGLASMLAGAVLLYIMHRV